jgi:hypothetical protein
MNILDTVEKGANAPLLSGVAPSLPGLVAAAAFHTARHNLSETIVTSWVVVELILYSQWSKYLQSRPDSARRRRLKDTRTYTASIQAEVLVTAGLLQDDLYKKVQAARKIRNDFAHEGSATADGAAHCIEAMRAMIQLLAFSSTDYAASCSKQVELDRQHRKRSLSSHLTKEARAFGRQRRLRRPLYRRLVSMDRAN